MAAGPVPADFEDRLGEVFRRTLPLLGPEVRRQLAAIITPESLAIIGGVLIAWVASHAVGVGLIADVVLGIVGVATIGLAMFSGIDHLWDFATITYRARSSADLDRAAHHLAQAISILGVTAVLAVLFRGRPQVQRGGVPRVGPPPLRTPGQRYRPTTVASRAEIAGAGYTTSFGDIVYSSLGTARDRALVLAHEQVHQFLTPKLYLLRNFRIAQRDASYFRSSLSRYLEEAVAETRALVRVDGLRQAMVGVRFPVRSGYVYLIRRGADPKYFDPAVYGGSGVLPEAAGVISVGGGADWVYNLYLHRR